MRDKDSQREYGLDILKLFCSFLVVYIHAGDEKGILSSLSTVAVPIFFIISGYLYDKVIVPGKKERRQINRIFGLTCVWTIFYFIWFSALLSWSEGVPLWETMKNNVSIVRILKVVLFNAPSMGYHLWYLFALLYVLIILYLADRSFLKKYTDIFAIGLLIVGIIMPWLFRKFHMMFRIELVRNFLFEGLPLFIIGRFLYKKLSNTAMSNALAVRVCLLGIAGILFSLWEEHICHISGITSLFCGSYIAGISLVVLAVVLNEWISEKKMFSFFAMQDTAGIYVIHLCVLSVLVRIGMNKSFLTALLVFLLSYFLVLFWHGFRKIVAEKFPGGGKFIG